MFGMIRTSRLVTCAAMCCLVLGMHCTCDATQYKASVIADAGSGLIACATGIGNSSVALGSYGDTNPTTFFLWTQASGAVEIGGLNPYFYGAPNTSGQIVGTQGDGAGHYSAVVRDSDGTIRQLNYLNTSDNGAVALAASDKRPSLSQP